MAQQVGIFWLINLELDKIVDAGGNAVPEAIDSLRIGDDVCVLNHQVIYGRFSSCE